MILDIETVSNALTPRTLNGIQFCEIKKEEKNLESSDNRGIYLKKKFISNY